MAHGTRLTAAELTLMAARGAAVAHCPLSNFFFGVGRCRSTISNPALKVPVVSALETKIA